MTKCYHLWIKRLTFVCSKCGDKTDYVDSRADGELDWRDDATWKDFSEPIRRNYILKKEEEEKKQGQ